MAKSQSLGYQLHMTNQNSEIGRKLGRSSRPTDVGWILIEEMAKLTRRPWRPPKPGIAAKLGRNRGL